MVDLDELRAEVEAELRRAVEEGGGRLSELYLYHMGFRDAQGQRTMTARGKYLRPLFCLSVCLGLGGNYHQALPAAAALEIIHRTSLILDDIQDQGRERNGQPSVYAIWGANQAINAGFALSCYGRLAALRGYKYGLPDSQTMAIMHVLEHAAIRLCQGQYLDMEFSTAADTTLDDYMAMVGGKTAALFAAACRTGAMAASHRVDLWEAAGRFGHGCGVAFQAWDDYLGIWGDQQVGKPANDLEEGKRSLPVVLGLALPDAPVLPMRTLRNCLAADARDKEMVQAMKDWLEARGVRERTRQMATALALDARAQLKALRLAPEWYQVVDHMVEAVVNRVK